jgi:hypothetical protein
MAKRTNIVAEYFMFLKEKKTYWMVPIIITLLLLAAIVILGGTSGAPFIYTLF